jgi:hypothetical protein
MRHCLLISLIVFLSACALQEPLPVTLPPPLTIVPAPTLTLTGRCDENSDLADWLQFSMDYADQFATLVSETGVKAAGDMVDDVVMMGRLREVAARVPTPDCAEPAQRMMMTTMDRAIALFLAYTNREADSLDNVVAETLGQIDQISVIHDDLMQRLEAQLQAQNLGN